MTTWRSEISHVGIGVIGGVGGVGARLRKYPLCPGDTSSPLLFKLMRKRNEKFFSRFGSSVDFSSGEPLGGVGAPTVGADLCVRLSSSDRSMSCGRTRRSAPTRITSTRQIQPSNAVIPVFVWTHSRASIVSKRDE